MTKHPLWKDEPKIASTLRKVNQPMGSKNSKPRTYTNAHVVAKLIVSAREGADIREMSRNIGPHTTTIRALFKSLGIIIKDWYAVPETVPDTFNEEGYPQSAKKKVVEASPVPRAPGSLAMAILAGETDITATLVGLRRQLDPIARELAKHGIEVHLRDTASGTDMAVAPATPKASEPIGMLIRGGVGLPQSHGFGTIAEEGK